MKDIVLTTDSGMCAIQKDDSIVIPAQLVTNDGRTFSDYGQVSNEDILNDMKKGIIYKTSSPLLGDYDYTFRSILENGQDVIHLSMSSGISEGGVNGANLVAKELNEEYKNQIYVIDSLTGATGGTLLYELAYRLISNSSLSSEELVQNLNELKTRLQTSFYVPNAEGYIRSGRDKTSSHVVDSALLAATKLAKKAAFKFRVDFHESGDLQFKKVFRSSEQNGMQKMVMDIVNDKTIEMYDPSLVAIGNLYQDKVDMDKIRDYLSSFDYFNEIIEEEIGSVVAAYGCNDLCGISLVKKPHYDTMIISNSKTRITKSH